MNFSKKSIAEKRKFLSFVIILLIIPLTIVLCFLLFSKGKYLIISIVVAFASCAPFFIRFERRKSTTRELLLIAIFIALSAASRIIFNPLPAFKPITAIIIVVGMNFGPEVGFLTGSLSALLSNMYFGQGPFTPFQMFAWGVSGFLAGIVNKIGSDQYGQNGIMKNPIILSFMGAFSGILFSLMMDVWTMFSADGGINLSVYLARVSLAIPFTIMYAVSNVIFLLILAKPMGKILERIKIKYGLLEPSREGTIKKPLTS